MEILEDINIKNILKLKGNKRLQITNDITNYLLNDLSETLHPGLKLQFLISTKHEGKGGNWNEYDLLFSISKINATCEYASYVFKALSDLAIQLEVCGAEQLTIKEFDMTQARYVYVLINLIEHDGREK